MEGFCSICGGVFHLRRNGTVRKHRQFDPGRTYGVGPRWLPCPGSHQLPKELPANSDNPVSGGIA